MSAFVVNHQGGAQLLRESVYDGRGGRGAAVQALRYGVNARPAVRLAQVWAEVTFSYEMGASEARALAAELSACADAIDAVTVKKGGAA